MKKKKRGSVLVFSLMILFIGLVAALGIASTSLISRKTSLSTGKSVSSFQVADSGTELVLRKINKSSPALTDLTSLKNSLGAGWSCSGGIISGPVLSGTFSVSFQDSSDNNITNCSSLISDVAKIKANGTYAGTTRAVEVAVDNDSYTKLLVQSNGANGSTSFSDSSSENYSISSHGDAKISTAQYKFGGSSALFDGSGDYLTVPDNDDWDFGSGDFTIDTWVRFSGPVGSGVIVSAGDIANNAWTLWYNGTGLSFFTWTGSTSPVNIAKTWSPSADTWYHVALVRNGSSWKFFVNGSQIGTTESNSSNVTNTSSGLNIGSRMAGSSPGVYFKGYIDEFRISKGIARWTSDFTPPASEY